MYLHLKISPERVKGHAASPAQGGGGGGGVQNANRVSAAFDVARWGQSLERWRRFRPSTPHRHTPLTLPLALCSVEEMETRFTFSSCGWFYCLPDCVRHINVYGFFSFCEMNWHSCLLSLYISCSLLLFLSCNTTLCKTAGQWLSAGKQPGMWNEAFVKLTLNFGREKKKSVTLYTLACWMCCEVLLSSLLLMLREVNESRLEQDHWHALLKQHG